MIDIKTHVNRCNAFVIDDSQEIIANYLIIPYQNGIVKVIKENGVNLGDSFIPESLSEGLSDIRMTAYLSPYILIYDKNDEGIMQFHSAIKITEENAEVVNQYHNPYGLLSGLRNDNINIPQMIKTDDELIHYVWKQSVHETIK